MDCDDNRGEGDLAAAADDTNAVLKELAAAGCPLVEVHEPSAVSLDEYASLANDLSTRSAACSKGSASWLRVSRHRRRHADRGGRTSSPRPIERPHMVRER